MDDDDKKFEFQLAVFQFLTIPARAYLHFCAWICGIGFEIEDQDIEK